MGDPLYDRLGVAPDATDAEVRQAWLRLARAHHPDVHADPASRTAAEAEMRSINEAWSVLGDPARRAAHDARRRSATDGSASASASTVVRRADDPFVFVPIDDGDDDDVDPRLLDDTGVDGTEVSRTFQFLPVVLGLGGGAGVLLGFVLATPFLLAVGAVGLVLASLSFVIAPLQAIGRSISAERRGAPHR